MTAEVPANEFAPEEAASQQAAVKEPAAKKPKKTVTKKRAVKKFTKKRATKKPATKRAAKKRTTKKRTPKKKPTAAKKSVAKKTTAKKPARKKRKAKKQPALTSKAQAIRDAAKQIGGKPRPKDVIAALAEKGINVVSAQVSTVLKALGLRRKRRGRKAKAVVTGAPTHSANGHVFNINELLQVKKLADQLGGTTRLKELAAVVERLV